MEQKTILVIEDDKPIRETLTELLELEGYQVQTASNGEEGLERLRSASILPNLILLDLMMPVKDGFQFRTEQSANPAWAQIPVIIMSADGRIQEKQARAQAAAYLKKPPEIDLILTTIRKHIT